ncbi:MAG: hypothetical protein JOZ06_19035, partial [Paludibacterium sp.]|nr:hypothetical protein [Paludibacterium sp.]
PAVERDLRDIQFTVDRLVHQLAPWHELETARSLLAAISYKLSHVQAELRQ